MLFQRHRVMIIVMAVISGVSAVAFANGSQENPSSGVPTAVVANTQGSPDTDGDGIPDAAEVVLATDPGSADTDGDGTEDLADEAPLFTANLISEPDRLHNRAGTG
jgi:hypothetical protein